MGDWRKRAKSHRGLLGKGLDFLTRRRESIEPITTQPQTLTRKPMIHIGIDFGTSWTKVAYRVLQSNRMGVQPYSADVAFPKEDGKTTPFARSVIYHNSNGVFRTAEHFGSDIIQCDDNESAMTEFKMSFNTNEGDEKVNLISLFFLSRIIHFSKKYITTSLELNGFEDQIEWSATLGIPTGYIHSPIDTVTDKWLKNWFQTEREYVGDLNVMPELQASIFSLTHDTKFPEGIFSLFDIGGGTLDGSVFHFTRSSTGRKINVLRSQVIDSGVEKIKSRISNLISEKCFDADSIDIHTELLNGCFYEMPELKELITNKSIVQPITEMTAKITKESKESEPTLKYWKRNEFPFLYSGGGASFEWFRKTIEKTYSKNSLNRCNLPRFKSMEISEPDENNLAMNALKPTSVKRFLVAYGLSYPQYEHDRVIAFPDHNPIVEKKVANMKDQLYERQLNGYGEVD